MEPGHRGDDTRDGWGSLEFSTDIARAAEAHGWGGALIGTGWGRPDTFTVATALAARTTSFKPLVAIRPGYWHPANFASAAATLDNLSRGRLLINVVSGLDHPAAYGDGEIDPSRRYDRTLEFLRLVRRLWLEEQGTHRGEFYSLDDATVSPRPHGAGQGRHPRLYFGGASAAAERVSAAEAVVQLFWGEPLDGVAERIARLKTLSETVGRRHAPLEFGLRVTTLIRDTAEEAWRDAEAKVVRLAEGSGQAPDPLRRAAVGQQRLLDLGARGEVLDSCLYTTPGQYGAGGARARPGLSAQPTTSPLSDTPYRQEVARVGDQLLSRLRTAIGAPARAAEPAATTTA